MADPVLISNVGAENGQNAYRLPPNLGFHPTAVTALFDGSASGSPFLACLTFYSQSGQVIARQFPETPIGAGETVEASFAPFLGRGSGSTPTPSVIGMSSRLFWVNSTLLAQDDFSTLEWELGSENALGVSVDFDTIIQIPGIGSDPAWLITWSAEVSSDELNQPTNVIGDPPYQIPRQEYSWWSGTLGSDLAYSIGGAGVFRGNPGVNSVRVRLFQDSATDISTSTQEMLITYLGQFQ